MAAAQRGEARRYGPGTLGGDRRAPRRSSRAGARTQARAQRRTVPGRPAHGCQSRPGDPSREPGCPSSSRAVFVTTVTTAVTNTRRDPDSGHSGRAAQDHPRWGRPTKPRQTRLKGKFERGNDSCLSYLPEWSGREESHRPRRPECPTEAFVRARRPRSLVIQVGRVKRSPAGAGLPRVWRERNRLDGSRGREGSIHSDWSGLA